MVYDSLQSKGIKILPLHTSTVFVEFSNDFYNPYHAFILIAWLAEEYSLMCCIATMGRQIAKMFYAFSLWGSLFLMLKNKDHFAHYFNWFQALVYTLTKNVVSVRRNHANGVALEGTCWVNQEGKTCAELVGLTVKVIYTTRNVFQVMFINLYI